MNAKRSQFEGTPLGAGFFDRDPQVVACDLIGKVLAHHVDGVWLQALLIETEAYYRWDRASHASLGFTEKRRALYMPPGTIYMYYARGGDSFNVSCHGDGNAVLLKAGVPYPAGAGGPAMLKRMARLNPLPSGRPRPSHRLCAGQTLLCRALDLRVKEWDGRTLGAGELRLLDVGLRPAAVIRTTRLGIPPGRDGHLPFRFIDLERAASATRNPLTARARPGPFFERLLPPGAAADGATWTDWSRALGLRAAQPAVPPMQTPAPGAGSGLQSRTDGGREKP